ncbi:Hypothetical protein ING2D1G_0683 [Peptoniphilus sp. ING2-D1G]|nr:Hypothetical protein ING2D1G_0683 [Peptoniphilus sp. ING2-D1G]
MKNYSDHMAQINYKSFVFELPRTCPHCNHSMTPDVVLRSPELININGETVISLLCQCIDCKEFFALTYKLLSHQHERYPNYFKTSLIPYNYSKYVEYDIPKEIEEFSPTFKEIYQQSQTAEAYNLNHIAGIGFRKSIEFLVKDFLINVVIDNDEEKSKISKLNLSQAIDKLHNQSMINLAKAATWIGNDETHYIKKYQDKDINDMKKYIRALSHHLSSEYLVLESASFINGN